MRRRRRPDRARALDQRRPRLPGRRARARVLEGHRRARRTSSRTDDEALAALERLARTEGILCALETAHAIAALDEVASQRRQGRRRHRRPLGPRRQGHGHGRRSAGGASMSRLARCLRSRGRRAARRARRVPDVRRSGSRDARSTVVEAAARAGADVIELGVPFSRSVRRRPVDPARDGARARGGRRACPARSTRSPSCAGAASRRRSCCSATTTRSS